MITLQIKEIEIDGNDRLLVRPGHGRSYPMIYRAANGLRWNDEETAIVAFEPSRWKHEDLLCHIIRTLESECDEVLVVVEETKWLNVDAALKQIMLGRLHLPAQDKG